MRRVQLLDGVWDFAEIDALPVGRKRLPDIFFDSCAAVPGCFDVVEPNFGRRMAVAYRRRVTGGGRMKLTIDGVGVAGKVYWDSRLIGTLPYAYMPESFVFDAGTAGEHLLTIAVDNHFNSIVFPFYDFYCYGGIFGSVSIEEIPDGSYVDSCRISCADYRTGTIRVELEVEGGMTDSCRIAFDDGNFSPHPLDGRLTVLFLDVPDFQLWSPAFPALHRIRIRVGEDEIGEIFGIREIRVDGTRLLLNGGELRLMGYNRHESHPQCGSAMPPELIWADLKKIRAQGCNFIRGSHYPQRRTMLEFCDRLGLLVWEETLGWDVKPPELFSRRFRLQQLDQLERLIRSSFNHPSVIIRGFLNETESQLPRVRPLIAELVAACHKADPTRPVSFASNKYERDLCMDLVDIVSMNPYPGWGGANWERISDIADVRPRLEKLAAAVPVGKPLLISEIGGGATYGFRDPYRARWSEEYQAELLSVVCEKVLNDRRFCGLCIWQYCNAKSYINGYVACRACGFNDKGVLDEYRRPKLAWDAVGKCIEQSTIYLENRRMK